MQNRESGGVSNCIADVAPIGGDHTVNIDDLTTVILHWGACSCFPAQAAPPSLSQVIADAGLTQSQWNEFLNVVANGSEKERQNYNCWLQRRISHCEVCPACPSSDPFEE
ncbi:MAG TPA: hypothetical protein VG711_02630 [Phycisphaerales bacterium]|nr:hypothetical protein [Phycisphaerales bacterium]